MVACRFIVIKKPFLSKSQNTFPGERGTLPKAGNHSPVKFLDLSSDFPGSHRGTTARLTGTLSPGLRPARIPSETRGPAPPEPSRLNFYPAPAPHRAPAARHTGTPSSRLPPGPRPSQDPQPSATRTIPAHFPPGASPKARPGIALCLSSKGETRPVQRDQSGEAESPPPREIMSIKGYKAVTFYHKSAAFARAGKEFPAYFRDPRSFWGDFGHFPGFLGCFRAILGCFRPLPGDLGLFFSGKD